MAPESPREQEQSIKARKRELFEAQRGPTGPTKRFSEYVDDTPPSPLSSGQKAMLWALSVLVLLLFLAAMLTIPSGHRTKARPTAESHAAGGP
jgi:hypothetical protein